MQERVRQWFGLLGCGAVLAVLVAVVVTLTGRAFPLVVAAVVLVVLTAHAVRAWRRSRLLSEFRRVHGTAGKDLLLVYTASPHWQPYIETSWLPRWEHRAITLNRSAPWSRTQLEVRLWRAFALPEEHTPVAIVIPRRGRPRVVRFWRAFRDFKHGKDRRLRAAEGELEAALRDSGWGER